MSGHSQFKNIMHRKGAQDKIRARTFSKLGREITSRRNRGCPIRLITRVCAPQ